MENLRKRNGTGLLIFLCWLLYASSYLGKVNYSANITQIVDFYGVTKSEAGLVPTFFFFSYGIGQVINGMMCKKYNVKWVVFGSLFLSGVFNLAVAVSQSFGFIKWLWLVNGFTLSLLWPSLIRLLSESLPKKDLGKSSFVMGTTVASGTLLIYGLSSLYAIFGRFKLAFFTAAFADITVSLVWLFLYGRATSWAKSEKVRQDGEENVLQASLPTKESKTNGKTFALLFSSLCFCAVGVNLVKDGLTTWVPSILKEEYMMPDSLSIFLTLLLLVVAIFANPAALFLHKKIPDYVSHCGFVFFIIGVLILGIIGSLTVKEALLLLVLLVAVNFLAASLNNLITAVFPLFMRSRGNSGLYAGVLDGFCYVGSAISSYGIGFVAENWGWNAVFYVLLGFCTLACLIFPIYRLAKRRIGKKASP
ncbi:MAG: MFS transporter [Clostridia bacterium]|nr:MFS transporter [Clostridia bacterium]